MRWEYQFVTLKDTSWTGGKFDMAQASRELNGLGLEGWELTAAFDTNQSHGASREYVFVLKRPVAA